MIKKTILAMCLMMAGAAHATTSNILPFIPPDQTEISELKADARWLMENPPSSFKNETELMCIAVSVYHEARGESIEGQKAAAGVIIQRAMVPHRWGDTPCDVVQPVQFSYLTPSRNFAAIRDRGSWNTAVRVALTMMITGPDPDYLGADHYHTHYVYPKWRNAMDIVKDVEGHRFYVDPDSLPRGKDKKPLAQVAARGFTNTGQVVTGQSYNLADLNSGGAGPQATVRLASIPSRAVYTNTGDWTEIPNKVPQAVASVQTRKVEQYDWSGTGVPTKTTIEREELRTASVAPALTNTPTPPQAQRGFGPVKETKVAQKSGGFGPVMGLPLSNSITANNGKRLGINPP